VSTTAKIFVVLLVLLSVAFAMVTVTFVSLSTDWKKQAMDWRAQAQAALVQAGSVAASSKAAEQQLQGQITQLGAQIEQLQAKLGETERKLSDKTNELIAEKGKRESAEASVGRIAQLQELDKNRAERLEKRNQELLSQTIDLQKRNQDLNNRVKELTQQVTIKEEQVRALKEQRYALEQQLAAIQKSSQVVGAPPAPGTVVEAAALGAPPPVPIRGQILEVKGNVASISVGSADGVTEGMSFIVYRGKEYLGKLRITTVEPNRSGGDLALVRGEIRPQDRVADERSFGAER